MNDREYTKQKTRVRKLIKKWVKALGFGWWQMEFAYCRESKHDTEPTAYSPKLSGNRWVTIMETGSDPYYKKAMITVYIPEIVDLGDDELEEVFLHELMHVFLSPMKDRKHAKEEEFVAQSLAQAFIWAVARVRHE